MNMLYFGFAIADGMFNGNVVVTRTELSIKEVKFLINNNKDNLVPCINPSHVPTINAMKFKYELDILVPEKAPIVRMKVGDKLIVMSVRGLPRLEGVHEYSEEVIEKATFNFALWELV
jgi:hypothetical protein